jgi:hypothetical protein
MVMRINEALAKSELPAAQGCAAISDDDKFLKMGA